MRIDQQTLDAALAPLNVARVQSLTELAGGSAKVFRIDLSDGSALVLKTYPDDRPRPMSSQREIFAARLLDGSGISATRHLMTDDSRAILPFRFAITNYLPGAAGGTFKHHADATRLYRQMGALARRLHAIVQPAYGAFGDTGILAPKQTNEQFIDAVIGHAFNAFAEAGGDVELGRRLRAIVDRNFEPIVLHSAGPVFAHSDLHPNNVLATEDADGRLALSGLIDFGNAQAADAVFDLAKCLFCTEHDAPGSTPHILAGYGPIDHPHPQAALDYYTHLHRLIMWSWLRKIGVLPTPDAPSDIIDALREAVA